MNAGFRIACAQMRSGVSQAANIATMRELVREAAGKGAQYVQTPEMTGLIQRSKPDLLAQISTDAGNPVFAAAAELSRDLSVWVQIGSTAVSTGEGRVANRAAVFAPNGDRVASYDKIHMFDVDLGPGKVYRESATIAPGDTAVIAPCAEGSIGLSICYDLRFAALYRTYAQAGAEMLATPAAFTRMTGEAHWHVLQRARAIENGAYVIAPCQYGTLAGGSQCYGHSLIVDPWGRVLADGGIEEGIILAEIDLAMVAQTRSRIPSLRHDRPFALG